MNTEDTKLPSYGGQALIEGILMRGSKSLATAMRSPDGEIVIQQEELGKIYQGKIKNIPFLRGLVLLWDALGLGMRYLTISANIQTGEDEDLEGPMLYLTIIIAVGFAIGLFFVGPAALGQLLENVLAINNWMSNLIEGLVRLIIVIGYIWAIGKMPDIERVFAYHGAEHKTINAFEDGVEMTVENTAKYSVEHPRCGTSFILTLVLFSIIIFAGLGPMTILWRLISRIVFLPVLAGIAYEYIRLIAAHREKGLVQLLMIPNLKLQHLTTREPDTAMLEVGLAAFNAMIAMEEEQEPQIISHQIPERPTSDVAIEYQSPQK